MVLPTVVLLWLLIGAFAAGRRGSFSESHYSDPDCGSLGSTVVTVLAGPLNHVGVNPEIECPEAPEPSE